MHLLKFFTDYLFVSNAKTSGHAMMPLLIGSDVISIRDSINT